MLVSSNVAAYSGINGVRIVSVPSWASLAEQGRGELSSRGELDHSASAWRAPMAAVKRRYSKREFARRGIALFRKLRAGFPAGSEDQFVAIDIDTGEYETHANEMTAAARLRKRLPDAQIWLVNIGTGFLDRFGRHGSR